MPKTNGTPAEPKPYKPPTTPLACLLVGIKVLQGYAPDDRAWDAGMFGRYSKPASELLKFFEGDWKEALKTSEAMVNDFKSKGLSWTVETLVRHAPAWKNKDASPR